MDSLRSPLAGGLSGSPPRLDVADTVTLVPSFLPVNADDERRFNEPAASAQAAQFVEDEDRPTMSVTKGSAGMKWDTSCVRPERVELAFCLQVSQDVGFTYVPSEGSSVRFDPPNAAERVRVRIRTFRISP